MKVVMLRWSLPKVLIGFSSPGVFEKANVKAKVEKFMYQFVMK